MRTVRKSTLARAAAAALAACLALTALAGCNGGTSAADYAEAETQWDAAIEALEPMFTDVEAATEGDISDFDGDKLADDVRSSVEEARTDIEQAKQFVAGFDDSEAKTRYVQSLDSALDALAKLDIWSDEVRGFGGVITLLDEVGKQVDTGNTALNAAGDANTANDWAKMKTQAQTAQTAFSGAVAKCDAQHKADPALGFDKFSAILGKKKAMADQLVVAADSARANRISAYNKAIDQFNALNGQLSGMEDPAFADDPGILMEALFARFGEAVALFEKADEAHGKAYQQIEAGNL